MNPIAVLPGLTPENYRGHPLHGDGSDGPPGTGDADLWIAFVHTLGLEPAAMLASTVAANFEGDQWTAFQPPLPELRALYGIDVRELAVWHPLLAHAREHLAGGKLIHAEVDALGLPDARDGGHRRHAKTRILMAELDEARERLGYFHETGYFDLRGEDFRQLFRLDAPADAGFLPPFAQLVRLDRLARKDPAELADESFDLLRRHFAWRPRSNPFSRFAARLAKDLPELREQGLAGWRLWSGATVCHAASAFELLAAHLRWLATQSYPELDEPARHFDAIGSANTSLLIEGARAVGTGAPLAANDLLQAMANDWERGMAQLASLLGEG